MCNYTVEFFGAVVSKKIEKKGTFMEICGMPLSDALVLLLESNFSEAENSMRMIIKYQLGRKTLERSNGDASLVAEEVICLLSSIKEEEELDKYPFRGISDLLSIINGRSEPIRRNFSPEIQKRINNVIRWEEWKKFPPESAVHVHRCQK